MQLLWVCLVCSLLQLGNTRVVYEADLRDFKVSDYGVLMDNPSNLLIKSIRRKQNHGIEARLDPFAETNVQMPLSHVQFLLSSPAPLPIDAPFLRAYWKMAAHLDVDWHNGPAWKSGVSHKKDDPRLGCAGASLLDAASGIVANFFLTNHGIWAQYERIPIALDALGPYQSFAQIRRVASRSPDDIHELSIEFDAQENSLTWFVGLNAVARVEKVGLLGDSKWKTSYLLNTGEPVEVRPTQFLVSFSAFTTMDFADPWKESSPGLLSISPGDAEMYAYPTSWIAQSYDVALPNFSSRTYGQSISLKLFEMEAHAHAH
eukprot:TRINITY_DN6388_c0_g4_i2.p1 TRINITY_DN6388_c0_g4~~TRINITY_DN6388_c0_g4_i2.p1  ORF type:complete len:317 (+),score=33.22 TRINITY_DN6388_c0_g4_i2:3-953(+)